MKINALILVVVSVAATVAVVGWARSCVSLEEAERRAGELADTAAAAEARADSAEARMAAARDSLREARTALDSLRAVASAQADSLSRVADRQSRLAADYGRAWEEAVEVARNEIPPPYLPAVDTLVVRAERRHAATSQALEARTAETERLRTSLGLAEETIANLEREVSVQDSLHRVAVRGLRDALEAAREEAALWEAEARPGFFGHLDKYLKGAAAGGSLVCAFTC